MQKPAEYIQKELDVLSGVRLKLLTSTDWTQFPDSGLTLRSVMKMRFWRHKVRKFVINKKRPVDKMEQELSTLDATKPVIQARTDEFFKTILNDFNYSTIANFKTSCILILQEVHPKSKFTKTEFSGCKTIDAVFARFLELL